MNGHTIRIGDTPRVCVKSIYQPKEKGVDIMRLVVISVLSAGNI